jgi:hypothetical protein
MDDAEQRAAWDNLKDAYDIVNDRLARLQGWLRVARGEDIGHVRPDCTWSQVADDIEFHVYPERSPADEADPSREDVEQAEAGTGVGPGSAEPVRSPDGELTCENACVNGIVPCWNPGGPCVAPNEPCCDSCGPCQICR